MAKNKPILRRILTKPRLLVLSGQFNNLASVWFGIIVVSPGLGAVRSFDELVVLLTNNLPWGIVSLWLAMKFAEAEK